MASKTVFLSAVSGEFREARQSLARELCKAGYTVKEQADFHLEPANPTLLGKLRAYIEGCDTVICLLGQTSGFMAPPGAEQAFRDLLPAGVDHDPWSYTQWEGFFRRTLPPPHHSRPRHRVLAARPARPPSGGSPRASWAYRRRPDPLGRERASRQLIVLRAMGLIAAEETPFNVPFTSIGDLFMGREPFMARLWRSFRSANSPVAIRAVHGMGGIGKTRAAVEYAHRHRGDYTAVLFVAAADPVALETNLAALTGVLRLPEDAVPEQDRRLAAVLRWLETHRDWLLILDNVDTPEAPETAAALWPRLERGHVLLTSRLDGGFEQGIEILDIGLLAEADAVAYLLSATPKRRKEAAEAAQVLAVARALDGLTLAVVIAGAYVNERRITFSRYLADWTANRDAVLAFAPKAVTRYPGIAGYTLAHVDGPIDRPRAGAAGASVVLRRRSGTGIPAGRRRSRPCVGGGVGSAAGPATLFPDRARSGAGSFHDSPHRPRRDQSPPRHRSGGAPNPPDRSPGLGRCRVPGQPPGPAHLASPDSACPPCRGVGRDGG